MTTFTATYSPDDNKLRLYASSRLDSETYARVKAAGFRWAPKQDLFVAPTWSPEREDLLLEFAGEIEDEDKGLVERAEERAERFEDYSDKRLGDAQAARKSVDAIADGIPFGQPILVGHHSERHARRDAARIENGMRKAVKMWETSKYWTARAAGALRHAKYKELPAVRHRRIKTIEADKRKVERSKSESEMWLKLWIECGNEPDGELQKQAALRLANMCWLHLPRISGQPTAYDALTNSCPNLYVTRTLGEIVEHAKLVYPRSIERCERWLTHYENRLAYERAMLNEQLGADAGTADAMAGRFDIKPGGKVLTRDGWLVVIRVNKANGAINSVTTQAPRTVHWQSTWKYEIERVKDYEPPTEELAAKVKNATALPPICNYPGEGFREMTKAEWDKRGKFSDFPYYGVAGATEKHGRHRVRQMPRPGEYWKKQQVFLTDVKRVDPPAPEPKTETSLPTPIKPVGYAAPQPKSDGAQDAEFTSLKDQLKAGIQVTVAPQLFPTPAELAEEVVRLAEIEPGHLVLEPSAGTGAIASAVKTNEPASLLTCVELNVRLAETLSRQGIATRAADFLECNGELGTFDRIVMNPPFERGADIKHIEHALTFLKPGGRLVAICANGPRQREQLQAKASEWRDLPAGTFKATGTMVNAALVVIEKD